MCEQTAPPPPRDAQAAALAFLLDPNTHDGALPRHIETHLSHLVLAGERAFKMKKAIDWSVVDYATPERRAYFCHREVAVNTPFARPLYIGVRTITRSRNALSFDGPGEPIEKVVEMRRFEDGAQLDVVTDGGRLTGTLVDATADAIAHMHARVPVRREGGRAAAEAARIAQLYNDVSPQIAASDTRSALNDWHARALKALQTHAVLIERRGRHGFVRRCHGDLHLSNICLWRGQPMPFDAIEFSEEIGTIDILYDLAFVLVDLELKGHAAAASRLKSRYFERMRDYGGLALMPLFISMRAMVRALVGLAKGRDPSAAIVTAAKALSPRSPTRLIAIGGLSGSGKTTLARALAARIGGVVIRSDVARKRLYGLAPEARLPQSAYGAHVSAAVHRQMGIDARRSLRAGEIAILDATFLEPSRRDEARAIARALSMPFTGVFLTAPASTLKQRLTARKGDASEADANVLALQLRRELGAMDWTVVDARLPSDINAAAIAETLDQASTQA